MLREGSELPPSELTSDVAELFAGHVPVLRRVLAHSVGPADIEDILQNTYERLERMRSGGRLDLSKPLLPLLVTLARRAAIDHWRTRPRETPDEGIGLRTVTAETPAEMMIASQQLVEGFRRLRSRDQRLLRRCLAQDEPYSEVAEAEGLTPGALWTAVSRARKRLLAVFDDDEFGLALMPVVWRWRSRFDRVRSTLEIELDTLARLGAGLAAAVAAVGVAVSAVGPSPASAVRAAGVPVASRPPLAPLADAREPGPMDAREARNTAGVVSGHAEDHVSPDPLPPAVAVAGLEVHRARSAVEPEPGDSTVSFYVEWDDPILGDGGHAEVESGMKCSHGVVAGAVCPVVKELPGAQDPGDT